MPEISGLYLQRGGGGRGGERKGSGKGKSIYHRVFIVLISEMRDYLFRCLFKLQFLLT